MKNLNALCLLLLLPFFAAAQTAKLNIKISNPKDGFFKLQLPVDGTWLPAVEEPKITRDTTITVEVPLNTTTWVRLHGYYLILEPGTTNVHFDHSKEVPLQYVDRNFEGIMQFTKRDNDFYQDKARAYYKKDSTESGLLKLIDQDRLAELKPYQDLLKAGKISANFYKAMDNFLAVHANIMQAAIPMIVFSETRKLSPELDHLWKSAYDNFSWESLDNTFHPDFYYHAQYYSNAYLRYYLPLKRGEKWEIKDETDYFKKQFEGFKTDFKGKMREYVMASFLRQEMTQSKFQQVLLELYNDFRREYPNSAYSKHLQPHAKEIMTFVLSSSIPKGPKINFIQNYNSIDSFEQLLSHFKDKTVYIDVWATWCGPCKDEFKYSKETFAFMEKNNVEVLFISTDKDEVDEHWKTMVKYYDLEGSHVRVNKNLLQDMLNKFWDGKGYAIPRYILVSNGKVVNDNMLRPSDKDKLYSQIKSLLKK